MKPNTPDARARVGKAKMLSAAVLVVASVLAVVIVVALPPKALPATPPGFALSWPVVRGVFHVHSVRSDGTGTLDEIAAAAARAGLQFVVVTDHGNGTRAPEPPAYRAGVLCIDGVEISTDRGHYVAIDLPKAPYPLAGDASDVIEDVRRLGGFGVAAHPGSPKPDLQWEDWAAEFDGLEWLNADSEWRDEFWGSLGRVLLTYAFRPTETLSSLLDRPVDVLRQWDRHGRLRRVPALAGADAHARLGFQQSDPYRDRVIARLPSYDVSFHAFVNHVILNGSLTGDAAADARLVIAGVREGRMFTSIDGLAGLTAFEMKATSGRAGIARPGEYLAIEGPVAIEARIAAPAGTTLSVIRDGKSLYEVSGNALRLDVGTEPGAYRIEAHLPGTPSAASGVARLPVPWVLSNPIYVGLLGPHLDAARAEPLTPWGERSPIATAVWQPEASTGSSSVLQLTTLEDGTPALGWAFTLASGPKAEQYAGMRFPADARLATHDRLLLRARSDAPRRIWAQLRAPGSAHGERWGKTFYLDTTLAEIALLLSDFRPLGGVSSAKPALDRIDSLLLVIDTLNSDPGANGRIEITDLWLAR
jgi:hypothetical protein